jgi:ABC-type amino acid transport substrate-binding protein
MRHWKHLSMTCITVLAAAVGVGAADYETPKNRSVKDVLPAAVAAGADYAVGDPVVADGYMYRFKVKSPALFDVPGTGALRKLEREIWAIGQLKQVTRSDAFLKSLKDQAGKPLVRPYH